MAHAKRSAIEMDKYNMAQVDTSWRARNVKEELAFCLCHVSFR